MTKARQAALRRSIDDFRQLREQDRTRRRLAGLAGRVAALQVSNRAHLETIERFIELHETDLARLSD